MRGSNGITKGPWKVRGDTCRDEEKTSTWWHLLSSRLDETTGRKLEHHYLVHKINIFWSRWLKPGPAWPKPDLGQIGEIWEPGNPEIWDPKKSQKKNLKIQIHVAQNVGKVWISRKTFTTPFGAIAGNFVHGPEKSKTNSISCLFSLVGQWALFTFGGQIGVLHLHC